MRIDSTAPLIKGLKEGKYQRVFITTHHKPDGDAMGSTLGLKQILSNYVKEVNVITPTDYSQNLHFLPGDDQVIVYEDETEKAEALLFSSDLIFCLDFNVLYRINTLGDKVAEAGKKGAKIVLMDHHQNPDDFYDYAYWDNNASSTCQLVFEFGESAFGLDAFNQDSANCLYTGMLTDTGSFKYSATSPKTHRVAASLLELGADHVSINERIYNTFSPTRSRLFGYCLYKKLELLPGLRTALIYLSAEELEEFQVVTGDTEGLVNFGLGIENIVLSVLIIDRTERVKMSFRSKGDFKANEFAAKFFNGGGHISAAGGMSEEPLDQVVAKFKREIAAYKDELNAIEL